jgi:hypothetical protein
MIHVPGMEIPTITPQDISAFHALYGEVKALNEHASAAIEAAKVNSENELTIARDGKPVVVKEGDLWTEVWHLGAQSDGGQILAEKYPEPFKLSADAEKKKGELKTFALTKWNIDPLGMTLSDIMRICEAIVNYRLAEKSGPRKFGPSAGQTQEEFEADEFEQIEKGI